MTIRRWTSLCARALSSIALLALVAKAQQAPYRVASPDGRNVVQVESRDGALRYGVLRDGRAVITPSRLGFAFKGAPPAVLLEPPAPVDGTTVAPEVTAAAVLALLVHAARKAPAPMPAAPSRKLRRAGTAGWSPRFDIKFSFDFWRYSRSPEMARNPCEERKRS